MADTINVTITEDTIACTVSGASTWNAVAGKPTPSTENDFLVANSDLSWVFKTLDQVKTVLGLGSIAAYDIWIGTEAEYTALGSYSDTTLYFTT